jgi:hypothetical protein
VDSAGARSIVRLAPSEPRPAASVREAEALLRGAAADFVVRESERLRPPEGSEALPIERLRLAGSILHREVDRLPPELAERLASIVGGLADLAEEVARG